MSRVGLCSAARLRILDCPPAMPRSLPQGRGGSLPAQQTLNMKGKEQSGVTEGVTDHRVQTGQATKNSQ